MKFPRCKPFVLDFSEGSRSNLHQIIGWKYNIKEPATIDRSRSLVWQDDRCRILGNFPRIQWINHIDWIDRYGRSCLLYLIGVTKVSIISPLESIRPFSFFFGFSDGKQPRFQDPCEEFLSNKAYQHGIRSWLEFFECAMLCAAMKLLLLFCWVKGEK